MKLFTLMTEADFGDALRRMLPLLWIVNLGVVAAHAQRISLAPSERLQLLDCQPSSYASCFRLRLNAERVVLPPNEEELAKVITVYVDDQPVVPFYASASAAETNGRVVLILVDVSGSMNSHISKLTRFQAAQAAVMEFLKSFADGKDRVAIVPFESHNVKGIIDDAEFSTTKDDALDRAGKLDPPKHCQESARGKNCSNTALFSAVDAGLSVLLKQRTVAASGSTLLLIVLTDGHNEVYPEQGDCAFQKCSPSDTGLYQGKEVPAALVGRVHDAFRDYGVHIISVGVGNPGDVDQAALGQFSSEPPVMCQDPGCLNRFFARTGARLATSPIVATFRSPWGERVLASTRASRVKAALRATSGDTLESEETLLWLSPEIGLPLFEAKCTVPEHSALLRQSSDPAPSLLSLLDPMLVFVCFGAALLFLWFGLPRLIWGDRTIAELQLAEAGGRWGGGTAPARRPDVIPTAPASGRMPSQSPDRASVESTRPELTHQTGTRTRLEKIRSGEDDFKR